MLSTVSETSDTVTRGLIKDILFASLSFALSLILTILLFYVWNIVRRLEKKGSLARERVRNALIFSVVSLGLCVVFAGQLALTFVYMYADGKYDFIPVGKYHAAITSMIGLCNFLTAACVLVYLAIPIISSLRGERKQADSKASSSSPSVPLLDGSQGVPSQYDV